MLIDPEEHPDINIENLTNSISNAISNSFQVKSLEDNSSKLQKSNQRLSQIANYDALTGLANRRRFENMLSRALEKSAESNSNLELFYLDLDGFKLINDTFGHKIGDQLLKQVGTRITRALRQSDTTARLGGDEFAIIVDKLSVNDNSSEIANRVLREIREPYQVGDININVTASIGIARYRDDGNDLDTLLKNADTAMYNAKSLGRNRFSYFASDMNVAVAERLEIEQALRDGLIRNEFELFFQPRIDIETLAVVGFEALMRWFPRNRDLPPSSTRPDHFIPIAEATGFVVDLDRFAFQQACKKIKLWKHEYGSGIRISVNMSIARLQQQGLVDLSLIHI